MSISITASCEQKINYAAAHLKKQTIVSGITVSGLTKSSVIVRVTAEPEFIYEYKDLISVTGSSAIVSKPVININDGFFRQEMIESRDATIHIEAIDPEDQSTVLAFMNVPVRVQPYLHWDAGRYADTMPAFEQPNSPRVSMVLKKAGEMLAAKGASMSGYQSGSRDKVKLQAECIYDALRETKLAYNGAPASFETAGQKIRISEEILNEEILQGTCLDLAVCYATCLEAASLNSTVVVIPGHAFVAVWLENVCFTKPLVRPSDFSKEDWEKLMACLLPVECTTFTAGSNTSFSGACSIGQRNMSAASYICDTEAARRAGIVPVFTFTGDPICDEESLLDTRSEEQFLSQQEFTKKNSTKLDFLREQAMDVTTKSHLLNNAADANSLEFAIDTTAFMAGEVKAEELADGFPDGRNARKNQEIIRSLYSKSHQNIHETGKSNLFIAVNELKWRQESSDKTFSAVMYLCPAEIYRNTRGEHQLRMNPEEMIFNPALKVLLAQNYHLDSSKLLDNPGEAYREQMKFLSYLIERQKGWKIRENVGHLALYSIPNEAIWNSLFDKNVLKHEIVKGILESRMSWNNQMEDESGKENGRRKKAGSGGVHVFETDSSQNDIIDAAFRKKAQVVEGPAGNGKTTTIINVILEAYHRNKKVLFVSEMMPALDVAYEKLNEIMGGLFNLRIVAGRNHAADVIRQVRKTLNYLETLRSNENPEDLETVKKKYQECLTYLEQYYELMGTRTESGKSMEELLAMYEQYADAPLELNVDEVCEAHTLSDAEDQISILSKILEEYDRSQGEFAKYLRYESLDSREERQLVEQVHIALARYDKVWGKVAALRKELGITEVLSEKDLLHQGIVIARLLKKCPDKTRRCGLKAILPSYFEEEMDTLLADESEEVKKAVQQAAGQVAAGRGGRLIELACELDENFRAYNAVQKTLTAKLVRDASGFAKAYPDLPRKVLFEEWIEKRQLDTNRSRRLYEGIVSAMEKDHYGELIRQLEDIRSEDALHEGETDSLNRKAIMDSFYKAWALYHIDQVQEKLVSERRFNYFILQDKVEQLAEKEQIIRQGLRAEILGKQLSRVPNMQEGVSDNPELGILQSLVRRKKTAIRTLFEEAPNMLLELFPCMMMDPAAVAEYIPSDFAKFDLVLIDEGSQMPTYDALAPISRAKACMIFGDEKQLQPIDEFRKRAEDDFDNTLERESILTAAYITSMPRKMLRFHYRSQNESLIAFSNNNWYNGDIITFPTCDTNIMGVSYEFVKDGQYDKEGKKANEPEARKVISRIRSIYEKLPKDTAQTVGVITLNVHQRNLIQSLLLKEIKGDSELGMKVDESVSVVNLENCQGKEWDYVIISPGFAQDADGKVSASMGLLNRESGSNRLNVMLTRARRKMMVITSIEPSMLEGARSEGVQAFKAFLEFAKGDLVLDSRVCDSASRSAGLIDRVARELENAGYTVHTNIGASEFKVDLGIVSRRHPEKYTVGILVDHYRDKSSSVHDRELTYPKILERKGWKVYRLRDLNWHMDPKHEIRQIIRMAEACEHADA